MMEMLLHKFVVVASPCRCGKISSSSLRHARPDGRVTAKVTQMFYNVYGQIEQSGGLGE
jgi:hypothetical protein